MEKTIIAVKYENLFIPRTFGGKSYSYFCNIKVKVGDIVEVPTKFGINIARVSKINIPEEEIQEIKPYMKTVIRKINRDRFLKFAEIIQEAA